MYQATLACWPTWQLPSCTHPAPPPATSLPRLKDKRDEEDSDGEDEVAPLTEAEKEMVKRDVEKHRQDCRKVGPWHSGMN